ncbi:MAG: CotH kinase family protein [Erysipelotrichaceae bacterium]|nr:CotH kinase family protein [Erysipelotrichaceae bacterium]
MTLRSQQHSDIILLPYVNGDDYCFFIPSGMDFNDLYLYSKRTIYCDERIVNKTALSDYVSDEAMNLSVGDRKGTILFKKSGSVPAMFIETLKKDMDYVNSDKKHELDVRFLFLNEDGETVLLDQNAVIKGRGNNSWDTDKKSYNLKLEKETSLLGMAQADKWVLVPNLTDISKVYNKTVYSFAKETGLEWTPDCEYVDVYFDGEYNGLYLLCEKIEVKQNRLDLGKNGVLLKRELPMRLEIVDNGFETENGNVIEITYPKEVSMSHKEEIEREVQRMEDALFDLNSDEWEKVIDIDSWVRSYLIDELFDNLDAGIASAYFYLKDGVFYRGPVWDYDSIMWDNPKTMIADTYFRQPYSTNDYYYLLNQRKEFLDRVKVIFESEFRPLIDEYVNGKIDEISNSIVEAREMDCVRWNCQFAQSYITNFKTYLLQKADFMEEYWENRDNYCKILVQTEIFYRTFMVEKGNRIIDAINLDMSLFESNEYHFADSDEPFDLEKEVYEDIRLDLVSEGNDVKEEKSFISQFGLLNLAFSGLFVLSLLYVIIKGIYINV